MSDSINYKKLETDFENWRRKKGIRQLLWSQMSPLCPSDLKSWISWMKNLDSEEHLLLLYKTYKKEVDRYILKESIIWALSSLFRGLQYYSNEYSYQLLYILKNYISKSELDSVDYDYYESIVKTTLSEKNIDVADFTYDIAYLGDSLSHIFIFGFDNLKKNSDSIINQPKSCELKEDFVWTLLTNSLIIHEYPFEIYTKFLHSNFYIQSEVKKLRIENHTRIFSSLIGRDDISNINSFLNPKESRFKGNKEIFTLWNRLKRYVKNLEKIEALSHLGFWADSRAHDGLIQFAKGRTLDNMDPKYGYMDRCGNIIIQPQYDSLTKPFKDGVAIVYIEDLGYHLIDTRGIQITKTKYNELYRLNSEYYGFFKINGNHSFNCGIINRNGEEIIDTPSSQGIDYERFEFDVRKDTTFIKGVKIYGHYQPLSFNLYNMNGKLLGRDLISVGFVPNTDYYGVCRNGYCLYYDYITWTEDGEYAIIDKQGNIIVPFEKCESYKTFLLKFEEMIKNKSF